MKTRAVACSLLVALSLLAAGCQTNSGPVAKPVSAPPTASSAGYPRTVTDSRGKTLTLQEAPQRIVSLAPSNTELLYALGLGDRIAADTTACDYPPAAKQKPHIGSFQISLEAVEAHNPDLVVAVSAINQKAIAGLEAVKMPVLVLDPKTVEETYNAIRLLGRATGTETKADEIIHTMQDQIRNVQKTVAHATRKPKALLVYGDKPIYTTGPGSFIDDAIRTAGGQNVVNTPLPRDIISPEAVLQCQPDVILCDAALIPRIKAIPGWAQGVPAVQQNRFFYTSDKATLVQPGPRFAVAIVELAHFLHPELYTNGSVTTVR